MLIVDRWFEAHDESEWDSLYVGDLNPQCKQVIFEVILACVCETSRLEIVRGNFENLGVTC